MYRCSSNVKLIGGAGVQLHMYVYAGACMNLLEGVNLTSGSAQLVA